MRQMYKPENIEIGGRIRSAREALGMTRDEFAEAVGISSQFASDLERGRMGASVETICRICQVLGITTDQLLLGGQPEPGITAQQVESLLRGVAPCYYPHLLAILREEIKLINLAEGQR
ncbi:MAG: helix-turn-helix transcriptional regulator [Oscillospiraceae bacterium]|nr:helix-turn-helix transcriptional regulator [Oscillospiraceae bacterium]